MGTFMFLNEPKGEGFCERDFNIKMLREKVIGRLLLDDT